MELVGRTIFMSHIRTAVSHPGLPAQISRTNRLPAVVGRGGVLDQDYTKLSAAVCRMDYLASKRRLVV